MKNLRLTTILSILLFALAVPAYPSLIIRQDNCPANYAACARFNAVLQYCYDLLSGPVYGWPGSVIANAEAPNPYTANSIHINTPYMTGADVGCVCSAENSTPSGWDAADKCYFCEIPGSTASDIEEYTALVERWVVTCNTWGKIGTASAVTCWNTDLKEGCWVPD